ncbi:hypothetical protein CTI12_AA561810 [Artemisia annua]|uniref:Uncharacterized protein n=1 Tax=Artemisia annua TaxID=35608 RepID=A0A2U1KUX8_ARTAN|nr:hypothetical protein CTI12_AA561810 [Artemisia annua]
MHWKSTRIIDFFIQKEVEESRQLARELLQFVFAMIPYELLAVSLSKKHLNLRNLRSNLHQVLVVVRDKSCLITAEINTQWHQGHTQHLLESYTLV